MSREAAVEFLGRVRTDASLQAALASNPTSATYVELASRAGCAFSVDELRGVMNAGRFYERAANEPRLAARLSSAPDEAAVVALAAEEGFPCQLHDLKAVLGATGGGAELADQDLDAVAGGAKNTFSFPDVHKPSGPVGVPIPYPNFG